MNHNIYRQQLLDLQERQIEEAKSECVRKYGSKVVQLSRAPSSSCAAFWDNLFCWPDTPAGVLQSTSCPSYVLGYLPSQTATRQCMDNGVWFINKTSNSSWTNYNSCYNSTETTVFVEYNKTDISEILQTFTPVIKIIAETGYVLSFIALIIAFIIMLAIKKLHCARNILHMHLFASFILRAFTTIAINKSFVDGLGLPSDMNYRNGFLYFESNMETNNWGCKLMTSLWEYFITANYSWILMEGLYLHNLIFRALFADSSNSIKWYVIMGWGFPLIFVGAWVMIRLMYEDAFCWRNHVDYRIYLIIAIPTMISVVINLLLFARVSMVLYSKLRSPINEDNQRYQKWAKSTLVLVPLFGVHYALFLTIYFTIKTNSIVEVIWLVCDQFFGSFQGFFVAIFYCFLNGEVKSEILPHLYYFLTYLATNKVSKYFFPFRKKFLRSVVGRASVCTTMSCSSLCTNGVLHRSSKSCLDSIPKIKFGEKVNVNKTHTCNGKSLPNLSRRSSKSPHFHLNNVAETTLCIEQNPEKFQLEAEINAELSLRMMVQNDF